MSRHQKQWVGDVSRPLGAYRPCPCGCDNPAEKGVGYISWSNETGHGFTIWVEDERVFRLVQECLERVRV